MSTTYRGPETEMTAAERDQVREAVLTRRWSEARQPYAQSFGEDELDTGQQLMPIFGFLPARTAAWEIDDARGRVS